MITTPKKYKCTRCGHIVTQSTNHFGATWSVGRLNTCPDCPPWAKYPEFNGQTLWECLDTPCGEKLYEPGNRKHIAKCCQVAGTEHSHHDFTAREAIERGLAEAV